MARLVVGIGRQEAFTGGVIELIEPCATLLALRGGRQGLQLAGSQLRMGQNQLVALGITGLAYRIGTRRQQDFHARERALCRGAFHHPVRVLIETTQASCQRLGWQGVERVQHHQIVHRGLDWHAPCSREGDRFEKLTESSACKAHAVAGNASDQRCVTRCIAMPAVDDKAVSPPACLTAPSGVCHGAIRPAP